MNTRTLTAAGAAARLLNLPEWLAAALQRIGHAFMRSVSKTDARGFWRWIALNWHRVAAWWLCAGVMLSVLLGLLVAFAKGKGMPLSFYLYQLAGTVTLSSWSMAESLAGIVLVVALPVILPAALLSLIVLAGLVLVIGAFGPVLLLGALAFGLLFALAALKVGWFWALDFIVRTITRRDTTRSMIEQLGRAIGVTDAPTVALVKSADGYLHMQPRLLGGDELTRAVAQNAKGERGGRLLLGFVEGKPFTWATEKHVLIIAPSRGGKGFSVLGPNLKLYKHSVVVLDPKGENCHISAAARKSKGHTIAAFDPEGLTGEPCAHFDLIGELASRKEEPGALITAADYLAEALVVGKSDHWNESARGLIRALTLHLVTVDESELGGRRRDLGTLREWLTGALDVTLESMKENPALDGLISRLATAFQVVPDDERGGIVNTAQRATRWLDNPTMADLFKGEPGGVSFADLRDESKKLSIFIALSLPALDAAPQVGRLLITFAMDAMMNKLTGRKRPVQFILDELAQIGHLPIVERAYTLGAGYGMQVWAVFQSVAKAKALYSLDTLYGSAGIRLMFRLTDPDSVEYASKCTYGLMQPSAVAGMDKLHMLAILDGCNPLIVEQAWGRL